MLVAIGKRKNGVSETDFDRLHFSEENLTRHLTETELARIDAHLHQGGEKLTDEEKEVFGQHVRQCNECSAKIMSLPVVVFEEESIHTSQQPLFRDCRSITPPVRDITDWDEVSKNVH